MIPSLESWNINIVGQWNPRIFSPPWIKDNLIDDVDKIMVEGTFPSWQHKITAKSTVIIPSNTRLVVGTISEDHESLVNMTNVAYKSVTILSHTPVQGVGFNCGFKDSDNDMFSFLLDSMRDTEELQRYGEKISQISVRRTLSEDQGLLNIDLSIDSDHKSEAHFNFHYDVSTANEASKYIEYGYEFYLNRALDLLKSVYSIEINL